MSQKNNVKDNEPERRTVTNVVSDLNRAFKNIEKEMEYFGKNLSTHVGSLKDNIQVLLNTIDGQNTELSAIKKVNQPVVSKSDEKVIVEEAPAGAVEAEVVEEAPAEDAVVEEAPAGAVEAEVVEEAPAEKVIVEEAPAGAVEAEVVEEAPAA